MSYEFHSVLIRPPCSTVPSSGLHKSQQMRTDWKGAKLVHKDHQRAEDPALEESPKESGLLTPEETQARPLHYASTERVAVERWRLSPQKEPHGEGWDNRYKLHCERFHLDTRKEYFTVRTITHWYNFPQGTAASSAVDGQGTGHLSQAPRPRSRAGGSSNLGCSESDCDSPIILKACLERG